MTEIKYKDTIIKVETGKAVALHTRDTMFTEDIVITTDESTIPVEVSTEVEMASLLEAAEVGSVYKYTGESGTYENGALYVVEEDGVKLISFTIDGTEYQAKEGMTWGEWLESEYNTDGYYVNSGVIFKDNTHYVSNVGTTHTITSGTAYKLYAGGGLD